MLWFPIQKLLTLMLEIHLFMCTSNKFKFSKCFYLLFSKLNRLNS